MPNSGGKNNWAALAGNMAPGAASLFGGLFGGRGGQNNAGGMLDEIPGMVSPYFNPYIERGNQIGGTLQDQLNQLMKNPGALEAMMGKGYQKSPGYDFNLGEAQKAGAQASAAGGMAGSPAHQQFAAQTASNFANNDYNNYMGRVIGLYGQCLGGAQGMYGTGAQMGSQLAQLLAMNQMNKASLENQRAQQEQQRKGSIWGGLGSLIGGGLGALAGGPGGAMAGSRIGGSLF